MTAVMAGITVAISHSGNQTWSAGDSTRPEGIGVLARDITALVRCPLAATPHGPAQRARPHWRRKVWYAHGCSLRRDWYWWLVSVAGAGKGAPQTYRSVGCYPPCSCLVRSLQKPRYWPT